MGDYVKLNGLTPSLVCLIGLAPNFIYYYDPGSKIKKSKILQLIEPSKEEMKEIVRVKLLGRSGTYPFIL